MSSGSAASRSSRSGPAGGLRAGLGALFCALVLGGAGSLAAEGESRPWAEIVAAAEGQDVFWNAWAGDPRTNDFIAWVAGEMRARYGIGLQHVRLSDTAEAVNRVIAEAAAGWDEGGAVDLIWINGPSFLSMKERGLLFGPFVEALPNARFVDLGEGAPATRDFTVPVEGMESPWRLARFVFMHETARLPEPPRSMAELGAWAVANPGRMTHPDARNFMGATFLKQALLELAPDPALLEAPPTDETFAAATAPLWAWYDALRPNLWRSGRAFPENESVQQQLLADGEVDIAMAFDPAAAAANIARGALPESVRVFVPEGGTLGNISFVAIPYNASAPEGAMVVANFLLDPETQARAQNIEVLGAFSVLDPGRLTEEARAAFAALPSAPALPRLEDLGPTLPEPHPGWTTRLVQEWARRITP